MDLRVRVNQDGLKRVIREVEDIRLTPALMHGEVLTLLGQTHRQQEERIFATQGAAGGAGPWAPLNPSYAKRKRKFFPGKRILNLTGAMKRAFTIVGQAGYVQRFVQKTDTTGTFQFGAADDKAAAHFHGDPSLGPPATGLRPLEAREHIFGGRAKHLPVRDMVTKSAAQIAELRKTFAAWYAARVRRIVAAAGPGISSTRPR